ELRDVIRFPLLAADSQSERQSTRVNIRQRADTDASYLLPRIADARLKVNLGMLANPVLTVTPPGARQDAQHTFAGLPGAVIVAVKEYANRLIAFLHDYVTDMDNRLISHNIHSIELVRLGL